MIESQYVLLTLVTSLTTEMAILTWTTLKCLKLPEGNMSRSFSAVQCSVHHRSRSIKYQSVLVQVITKKMPSVKSISNKYILLHSVLRLNYCPVLFRVLKLHEDCCPLLAEKSKFKSNLKRFGTRQKMHYIGTTFTWAVLLRLLFPCCCNSRKWFFLSFFFFCYFG